MSLSTGDEQQTFRPPYVPELNEFFARAARLSLIPQANSITLAGAARISVA